MVGVEMLRIDLSYAEEQLNLLQPRNSVLVPLTGLLFQYHSLVVESPELSK